MVFTIFKEYDRKSRLKLWSRWKTVSGEIDSIGAWSSEKCYTRWRATACTIGLSLISWKWSKTVEKILGSFLIFENGEGQNIVLDHCYPSTQTLKLPTSSLISIEPGFFQNILRTMSLKPHSIFSVLIIIKITAILLYFSSLTALQEGSQSVICLLGDWNLN